MATRRRFDRLSIALNKLGVNGPWLYKRLDIGKAAYSNWKNAVKGQDVPDDKCIAIAKATPIRLDYLLDGETPELDPEKLKDFNPHDTDMKNLEVSTNPNVGDQNQRKTIPLVSRGLILMMRYRNDSPEMADLPRVESRSNRPDANLLKAYLMTDDSLSPFVQRGFILEFDPLLADSAKPGDVVMVRSGDLCIPRRFDPIEIKANGLEVLGVMVCQYWQRPSE